MSERTTQLFADTSSIAELQDLMPLGIFSGITTNPIIVSKEAGETDPMDYYKKLAKTYPDFPISIQLLDQDINNMLKDAHEYAAISSNIVIKVPMFRDGRGLTVSSVLNKEGIKTNITALMNSEQVLLALHATPGPTFVSLFFNRIKDGGGDPILEISRSRDLIEGVGSNTKIITGSIRDTNDIRQALVAGADIVTIPPKFIWKMVEHPQSELFIKESTDAWIKLISSKGKHKPNGRAALSSES